MKKTYLQPSTKEVRVQIANLLKASPNFDPNSITTTMDSRRRRRSLWDDIDDEEDY